MKREEEREFESSRISLIKEIEKEVLDGCFADGAVWSRKWMRL